MLLAVDIGNTVITFAAFRGSRPGRIAHVETGLPSLKRRRELQRVVRSFARSRPRVDQATVCSVVPAVSGVVARIIRQEMGVKPRIVGKDLKVPIRNRYRNPKQVGQDRLVCAYAASRLYGVPAIVIDLGTAITVDVVSARNDYLGGIIVPGLRLSAEALFQKTAMLPMTKIARPRALIGKDTKGSILSGIFYGYGAMLQGLIHLVRKQIAGSPRVVVTGGHTDLMRNFLSPQGTVIDRHLVLKGISFLSYSK